jgi:glycosyltransferase involved in cell wall biosynthesis
MSRLSSLVDYHVVFDAETEGNRHWQIPQNLPIQHTYARGLTLNYTRRRKDGFPPEKRELHLRYGVIHELVRLKPAAVVSQELGFRTLMAWAYCTLWRVPLIIWSEGTPHTEGWVGRPKRILRRLLSTRASRHWVNGVESAELIRTYAPEARIDEGMTGVDTRWFAEGVRALRPRRMQLREAAGVQGTCFLFVGQLVVRKGVPEMLAAIRSASQRSPKFTVMLAGEGPLRESVAAWQQENPEMDVRMLGQQSPEQLRELYAMADVFLLPTLDDNWALATLEGAVAGLPQVYSRYNGATAELTVQGIHGVTVDPLVAEEFAEAIAGFAARSPARLSDGVVDAVVTYYSPERFAERAATSIFKALKRT